MAAAKGYTQTVIALIQNGANVNATDQNGRTPLYLAVEKVHTEIAQQLIKAKDIDLNATNSAGYTPLHWAALYGHTEIALALIKNGAKVNATDQEGNTPLHLAAQKRYTEIALALIENNADVNATNDKGETPLHWAIQYGQTQTALAIIHYGQVPYADIPVIMNNPTSEYIERQYKLATTQDITSSYARGFFTALKPSNKDIIMAKINLFVKGTGAKDIYWHMMTLLCNKKLPEEMVKIILRYVGLNVNQQNLYPLKSTTLLPPAPIPLTLSYREPATNLPEAMRGA